MRLRENCTKLRIHLNSSIETQLELDSFILISTFRFNTYLRRFRLTYWFLRPSMYSVFDWAAWNCFCEALSFCLCCCDPTPPPHLIFPSYLIWMGWLLTMEPSSYPRSSPAIPSLSCLLFSDSGLVSFYLICSLAWLVVALVWRGEALKWMEILI